MTTDTNPNPDPNPDAEPVQPTAKADPGTKPVYAAYVKKYQRYTGGTHDTKKGATDAAKAKGHKPADIEVRDVS